MHYHCRWLQSSLLDTGAAVTLLRHVGQSTLSPPPRNSNHGLVGADDSQLTVRGTARVLLQLPDRKMPADVVVVTPLISEGILGLQNEGASIDLERGQMRLNWSNCTLTLHQIGTQQRAPPAKVCVCMQVPAHSEMELMAQVQRDMDPGIYRATPGVVAQAIVSPTAARPSAGTTAESDNRASYSPCKETDSHSERS